MFHWQSGVAPDVRNAIASSTGGFRWSNVPCRQILKGGTAQGYAEVSVADFSLDVRSQPVDHAFNAWHVFNEIDEVKMFDI